MEPDTTPVQESLSPGKAFVLQKKHYLPIKEWDIQDRPREKFLSGHRPDMPDEVLDEITDILLSTPLDGIVATNGTHRRGKLHTSPASIAKIGNGRLSGAPLTARAVEIVRRIHQRSGGTYPIIGVGGLMTPEEVKAMLDAGADLVQIYTGYIYNGPSFVKQICRMLVADAEAKATQS